MKKNALIILPIVFTISILIGGGVTFIITQIFFSERDEVVDYGDDTDGPTVHDSITPPPPTPIYEAISILHIEGPTPNPTTRKYSLTITAKGGKGELTFSLHPMNNPSQIIENHTGTFNGIHYTTNGKYSLIIRDESNNELVKEIGGFKTIYNRYTLPELTNRLSKNTADKNFEKHFDTNCKLHFLGIKTDDPIPTGHQQIHSNISARYWERVDVTDVEYNDYNKITSLTIQVYYTQF